MDEEFILYSELEENEENNIEEDSDIVINGNVTIEIHNYNGEGKIAKAVKKTTRQIRNNTVKPAWKNKIKNRDENKCQCCQQTFTSHLEVHHIMPIAKYNTLGSDDGNGIALCQKCHAKYHDMYKGNENAVTFAKFLRDFGNRIYK